MNKSFYITTTLPYVNAEPHVGFAMEIIRADTVARWKMLDGYEVFFNTGTDEHGQKLFEAAKKASKETKAYVDEYAEHFRGLIALLGISESVHFIRTTDVHHERAAQAFWKRVSDNGYIYKKQYVSKYCVGCEENKTEAELDEHGNCPIHPNRPIEIREEENYFFKLSAFSDKLLALYEAYPDLIIPDFRMNEMREFIKRGLEDFSISRLKENMSWGVSVPGDEAHVMYVWFDALTNYISTLGWPEDETQFERFWKEGTPTQYCGKDNTRFQSIMWQAMLLAAELPTTRHVVVNGFINSGGQKMSKSLGNVINPYEMIERFKGAAGERASDVLRYYLLRHVNSFEDSDVTPAAIDEAYQAHLANGIGNLTARIMALSETHCDEFDELPERERQKDISEAMKAFDIQKAMNSIWSTIQDIDAKIQLTKPFSVVKEDKDAGVALIRELVSDLYSIAVSLAPFLPKTSEAIIEHIRDNKKPETALFARLG